MVMVIPEGYERVVGLVGATAVELQLACPDLASLVAEAPQVATRVRRLAAERGLGDGLDFTLIGAAASLLRYRQLDAELHREQRKHRIAAAAAAGDPWIVVERGAPPTSWPPLASTTVEIHLASGRALEQTITMDEATGAPRFALTEVPPDPETGEPGAGEGVEETFADLQEWRDAIAARRRDIESGH